MIRDQASSDKCNAKSKESVISTNDKIVNAAEIDNAFVMIVDTPDQLISPGIAQLIEDNQVTRLQSQPIDNDQLTAQSGEIIYNQLTEENQMAAYGPPWPSSLLSAVFAGDNVQVRFLLIMPNYLLIFQSLSLSFIYIGIYIYLFIFITLMRCLDFLKQK